MKEKYLKFDGYIQAQEGDVQEEVIDAFMDDLVDLVVGVVLLVHGIVLLLEHGTKDGRGHV